MYMYIQYIYIHIYIYHIEDAYPNLAGADADLNLPPMSGSGRSCAGKDGETCHGCGTGAMGLWPKIEVVLKISSLSW